MGEIAYLNGEWMKPSEAKVSAEDRGFLFGDGVYEALVSYDGRIWALERHMRRLARSLREVLIEGVDAAEMERVVEEAARRSGNAEALVYLQVTRGAAPRSHDWKPGMTPTVFATARPAPAFPAEYYSDGVGVVTQPDLRWARCDVKSVNLFANVLALHAAHAAGGFEAVLVRGGIVTEGSHSGLFMVKGGTIITREDGPHVLPSVTQGLVLEIAADLGIAAERRAFTLKEMLGADEVFLTGTTPMVMPVTRVDARAVGSGKPGEITKRVLAWYRDRVARHDDAPR